MAHFIRQSVRRMNRPERRISKAALDQLASYHWPGNVRKLQKTVERAIILWQEGPFTFDLLASQDTWGRRNTREVSGEEHHPADA